MYESAFDTDWETVSREEAMFRAFALGVDAALGTDHPDELARLVHATNRTLVQFAYDEGTSRAEDAVRGAGDAIAEDDPFRPTPQDWAIWNRLVEAKRDEPAAFEMVRVAPSRTDLPGALGRPGFLDRADRDVEAIRLPRFLLE